MPISIYRRPFERIGLIGRAQKRSVQNTLLELIKLLSAANYTLVGSPETAQILNDAPVMSPECISIVPTKQIGAACDLLIVVGGDGTILQAVDMVLGSQTPILGINRGRLGFLADIHPDELSSKLFAVLNGDYKLDRRFLLSMQIVELGRVVHEDVALNDVVLHAGKSVHTIDFQLWVDGVDVYRQHADGLIVATPTGSTAYSLSAGGPIIHPSLSAICLAPMHPHTLSSRPILVADNSTIELKIHKDNRTQPMVSSDGKLSVPLNAGQVLRITKHVHDLILLHPLGFDFYEACRTKLNWNLYSEEFALSDDF